MSALDWHRCIATFVAPKCETAAGAKCQSPIVSMEGGAGRAFG
jgi:hypothetical protein